MSVDLDRDPASDTPPALRGTDVRAEILIGCDDVNASLPFYDRLGFLVDSLFPAEHPEVCALRGHGIRIRLVPDGPRGVTLRLATKDRDHVGVFTAPEGTTVEVVDADPPLELPELEQAFEYVAPQGSWSTGRAGMRYRDLIPSRQGGRFVGSEIQIPTAGPVPDYVHFHKVRFQMIYCAHGWVRLAYEDQGEPFVMRAGDCVIQPPQIRHRVLESGDELHVIEIGCPAIHETWADPETKLPTATLDPARDFGGQRFVRHIAAESPWVAAEDGFERRVIGFGPATDGLAEAAVFRPAAGGASPQPAVTHDAELYLTYVLDGTVTLRREGHDDLALEHGACVVIPAGEAHGWVDRSPDLQLLRVTLPADANR